MIPVLCAFLFFSLAAGYEQDYCFNHEENPYLMYGTKTAYEFVHEKSRNPEDIPHCHPIQFWMLSRHGTRFPDMQTIYTMQRLSDLRDQIINNREIRHNGRLCDEDLDNLKRWTLSVFPNQADSLTNQGYDDLKFMARRFKSQFPKLLNQTYSQHLYEFRFTDTQRTKASAIAFAEGLFGSSAGVYLPPALKNDTLIQAYKNCPKWKAEVDNNTRTVEEKRLFELSPHMQALLQNVSERLGFSYRLTFVQLDEMYNMCRFDKAWNVRQISPWCAVFSKEELQLMEYREDLEYYYHSGYGNDINVKLGCPTVKDLINRFSQMENQNPYDRTQPAGIFYFTHSTALQMTLAQLGIARDHDHLTHTNYNVLKNRKWRTSKISPFASNLAAVLFRCDDGENHRIMFYLGERLVPYDGCNVGLCRWSYIKDKFSNIARDCNLDFCYYDRSGSQKHLPIYWFTVAVVTIATFCRRNFK